MKSKTMWLIFSCLMVLSLVLVSCGTKTTSTTTGTTTVTTKPITIATTKATTTTTSAPTTTIEKPQYGGTFTYRGSADIVSFDPYGYDSTAGWGVRKLWEETLAMPNLTVDRNVYDFKTNYVPLKYETGRLAESWETQDFKTITFHIRKGVRWQDIPPVNGRELIAEDIAYSWNRQYGLGSGFTKPNPRFATTKHVIKSITATDKYTLVFQFTEPSLSQLQTILDDHPNYSVVAKEAVDKWGDLSQWGHVIGTGPFIPTDYVSGSSLSLTKNPNYWMHDPLFTENQLPYLDKVKFLVIPDIATTIAAMRTGKIDLLTTLSWQQALSLKKTNPELLQVDSPAGSKCILLNLEKKPYDDIRVRKAMQMAVDFKTIAQTYYGGTASPTPMGYISTPGYFTPFNEWATDVKVGYTYDPQGAKKLLAEAGYPTGFKANLTISAVDDQDLYQLLKAELLNIGIDAQIQVLDYPSWINYVTQGKHEISSGSGTVTWPPTICFNGRSNGGIFYTNARINDPAYDAINLKAKTTLDSEEQMRLAKQADYYVIERQWFVTLPTMVTSNFCQPWLRGYQGESSYISWEAQQIWVDLTVRR